MLKEILMRKSLKAILCLSVLSGVLCVAAPASATSLTDGQTLSTTAVGAFNVADFTVSATHSGTFLTPGGETGNFIAEAGHYLGSSNVSFLYQFKLTSGALIDQFSASPFNGYTTNVLVSSQATLPLGAGIAPGATDTISRNSGIIDVNFDVTAGQSSYAVLVNTNAPAFADGLLSVQDGGSQNLTGFQPTPEFGSATLMGLMLVGFGAIFGVRRFRMPVMA
jgi:hypothetical protein